MSTISIHVPTSLATIYEHINEEKKKKAEQYINAWLNSFLNEKSPDEQLYDVMQRASALAKKNGLTSEKPDQLLKDE